MLQGPAGVLETRREPCGSALARSRRLRMRPSPLRLRLRVSARRAPRASLRKSARRRRPGGSSGRREKRTWRASEKSWPSRGQRKRPFFCQGGIGFINPQMHSVQVTLSPSTIPTRLPSLSSTLRLLPVALRASRHTTVSPHRAGSGGGGSGGSGGDGGGVGLPRWLRHPSP